MIKKNIRHKQVVVIGSSDDEFNREKSYEIGKYIAKNKWILISGGKGGIMEDVSMGAAEEGGIVIGILPDSDFNSANRFCNIVIPTGIGYARNLTNILSGDVIIAIGGKSGTLSELAYAWQFGKPIICCSFAPGWSEKLSKTVIDDRGSSEIYIADTIEEVFKHLKDILH